MRCRDTATDLLFFKLNIHSLIADWIDLEGERKWKNDRNAQHKYAHIVIAKCFYIVCLSTILCDMWENIFFTLLLFFFNEWQLKGMSAIEIEDGLDVWNMREGFMDIIMEIEVEVRVRKKIADVVKYLKNIKIFKFKDSKWIFWVNFLLFISFTLHRRWHCRLASSIFDTMTINVRDNKILLASLCEKMTLTHDDDIVGGKYWNCDLCQLWRAGSLTLLTAFDYINFSHIWPKCAGIIDHRHTRTKNLISIEKSKAKNVRWNALIDVQKS